MTFETADLADLVRAREGHFRFESGHHGSLWLDLDALFLRPSAVAPHARRLGRLIAGHGVEVVCGPWSGGAFLAQMIAEQLDLSFVYSQPDPEVDANPLYSRGYTISAAFQSQLGGKRVAVVDDVINAGSAVTATLSALTAANAHPVVVASLMTLGQTGRRRIAERGLVMESLEAREHQLWSGDQCPLCARHIELESF
jgi:orotate phosphoribosyltransferase